MITAEMENYIDEYESLRKKQIKSELNSQEENRFLEIKEVGKSCKRYKDCIYAVKYLKDLISKEDDKEMIKIYNYDLENIKTEMGQLELKLKMYSLLNDDEDE